MRRPVPEAKMRPNPSHFRRVMLFSRSGQYIDPIHRAVFIPLWERSQQYETLLANNDVPYHTEDIAYTLNHLLEKVTSRAGVNYTAVYTETGRKIQTFRELPDYLSKLILGTETDQPPLPPRRPKRLKFTSPALVLSSIKLPSLLSAHPQSRSATSLSLPLSPVPSGRVIPTNKRTRAMHQSVYQGNSITLSGEAVFPPLSDRKKPSESTESSPEPSPEREENITELFTKKQLKKLEKEYRELQKRTLAERVNDAVQSSSRLPPNIQQYLSTIRSKAMGTVKEQEVIVTYLQSVLPVLQGKPKNVFQAVLQGLGASGPSLSWPQWLLLNSLLIHNTATPSMKISFISRVTSTQMLGNRPDYLDVMVLLTSMCGNDSHFQTIFQQLKPLFQAGVQVTPAVIRRKCRSGGLNYDLVLQLLRQDIL